MILQINDKKETLDGNELSVHELLSLKNLPDPDMVSVQLNGNILERDEFSVKTIGDGDDVEFLYFMGGGCGIDEERAGNGLHGGLQGRSGSSCRLSGPVLS